MECNEKEMLIKLLESQGLTYLPIDPNQEIDEETEKEFNRLANFENEVMI